LNVIKHDDDSAQGSDRARALRRALDELRIEQHRLADEVALRRAAETRFRATIEAAPLAMVMVDADGCIVLVNREAERLFGYSRDELAGKNVEVLMPPRHRARHREFRLEFRHHPVPRPMGMGRRLVCLRKDGSEFPAEVGISPIQTAEGMLVLSTILDITGQKQSEAAQRQVNDLLEQRVVERTAELLRANEALARSNQELQQFAYVASHDLQSPLRAIAGFAQLLQEDYRGRLDANADECIDHVVHGCQRMQTMIDDLLQYSRVQSGSRSFVATDLGAAVDDAVTLLQAEIESAAGEIACEALPTVVADRPQMTQLFQNLIGNAVKYHGDRPPQVRIWAQRDGNAWKVGVRDNGIGIDARHHERIFEVFRRLHSDERYRIAPRNRPPATLRSPRSPPGSGSGSPTGGSNRRAS